MNVIIRLYCTMQNIPGSAFIMFWKCELGGNIKERSAVALIKINK